MKAIRERVSKLIFDNVECSEADAERLSISVLRMVGKVRRACVQRQKVKLNTVNVIELQIQDNELIGMTSFADTPQGNKRAEKLFARLAKANSSSPIDKEDMEVNIENGYFEEGTYKVIIFHG